MMSLKQIADEIVIDAGAAQYRLPVKYKRAEAEAVIAQLRADFSGEIETVARYEARLLKD